jgi:RHS repeat-associated protein
MLLRSCLSVLLLAASPAFAASLAEHVSQAQLPRAQPVHAAPAISSAVASATPTSATTTSASGITTLYRFDADGYLVGETRQPGTPDEQRITYLVDTLMPYPVIVEEWTNEQLTRSYEWSPFNELMSFTDHASDGSTVTHFAHLDGFGSVRFLTDRTGTVTDTFEYDAFGNIIARTGRTRLAYLFRSERQDPSTGLYYLRARWMDPKTGRFTQMDSFDGWNTDPPSLHKYTYTHNDPVNRIDPSGHVSLLEFGLTTAVLSTFIGIATAPPTPAAGQKCPAGSSTRPTDRLCIHGDATFKGQVAQVEARAQAAGIIIFNALRIGQRILVHIVPSALTNFGPNNKGNGIVNWNSSAGALVRTSRHFAAYQSPALGLIHELGHAAQVALLGMPFGPKLPEGAVIGGIEAQWAAFYGEPQRYNNEHGGELKEPMELFEFSKSPFRSR